MLLKANLKILTEKAKAKTYLSTAIIATATALTVKNAEGFAANDWILFGEIGEEGAEVKQISAASGTSMTTAATTFAHDVDTPIYRLDYNQIEFRRGTTTTAADSSVISAVAAIQPSEKYHFYEDTTNTTGYGFIRYYNSQSAAYSSYSDAIPYAGMSKRYLAEIRKKVRSLLGNPTEDNLLNDTIDEAINIKQSEIAHERLWSFYEITRSFSSVANQYEYSLSTNVYKLFGGKYDTQPLAPIDLHRFNQLRWDADITGDPTHLAIWRNRALVYPYTSTSADTTTLNGSLTAAATTITVAATSSFRTQGRIIIESEVISYTGTTSTTFTGCTRGEEGTTAATHADTTTVTERDFIYHGQEDPSDLVDDTDQTQIPDPLVLVYGAAMDLAIGELENETLHDRLQAKYERALKRLKAIDERKDKSGFLRVKDSSEVVNDWGVWNDPNQFPQNINV